MNWCLSLKNFSKNVFLVIILDKYPNKNLLLEKHNLEECFFNLCVVSVLDHLKIINIKKPNKYTFKEIDSLQVFFKSR